MYDVTVYPESISMYVSQIYAGLYDLAAEDKIKLHFEHRFFHNTREFKKHLPHTKYMPFTLRLKIQDLENGQYFTICFDMADSMSIASMDDLKKVDIYIKRSYYKSFINELKQNLSKKIIPFGLHYACTSTNESVMMRLRQVFLYHLIHGNFIKNPNFAVKETLSLPLKLLFKKYKISRLISNFPLYINEFEVHPEVPAEAKIYFRTRLYSPEQAPKLHQSGQLKNVNDIRANTIRALKKHFGEQFVGGVRRSAFTKKYYPDCIFPENLDMEEHINLSKKYLICVNTSGLHDSTGWKFPEYLAASRCIISEPLKFELPFPIEKQKHYLPFTTPDECVEACRRILNDSKLAFSMRKDNYTYYENNVKPSMIIFRSLETALSKRLSLLDKKWPPN